MRRRTLNINNARSDKPSSRQAKPSENNFKWIKKSFNYCYTDAIIDLPLQPGATNQMSAIDRHKSQQVISLQDRTRRSVSNNALLDQQKVIKIFTSRR